MSRMIDWLKKKRFTQLLTVALAGIFVFISTGCNSGVSAKTADDVTKNVTEVLTPTGEVKDYQGVDSPTTSRKANDNPDKLIKNAEKNLEKRADTPEKFIENYREGAPLNKRVERLGEDVKESATDFTEGVTKGTQRGVENLKENTTDAAEDVSKSAKRSAKEAKEKTEDVAEDVAKSTKRSAEDTKEKAQETGENILKKTKRAAEDTADVVQDKASKASKSAQRALEDAADAID